MAQIDIPPESLTASERELVRREFDQHFSSFPSIAEGIFLTVWRAGPQAGQPKLPAAVQSLMARGLMEIRPVSGASIVPFSPKRGLTRCAIWPSIAVPLI